MIAMEPGELFVHRNVANLAPPQDANYLSVLQFAVDVLKVKHVLVVGHYDCGGVAAAVDGKRRGLVDHWLHPIREVAHDHKEELAASLGLNAVAPFRAVPEPCLESTPNMCCTLAGSATTASSRCWPSTCAPPERHARH